MSGRVRARMNRTRRKRIRAADARIAIRSNGNGGTPSVDAELDLASYEFPPSALVRIEAWRGNAVQRWDWGTVAAPEPPPDRTLTDVPESAQFRVMVAAGDGSGLLLGHAPRIRPTLPHASLLPLRKERLDGEVWRLDFADGTELPVMVVNEDIEDIERAVRTDAAFRSLVMPDAFRAVLVQIMLVQRHMDPDDEDGWWHDWFELARSYVAEDPPRLGDRSGEDEIVAATEWIDGVVAAFAREAVGAVRGYEAAQRERGR